MGTLSNEISNDNLVPFYVNDERLVSVLISWQRHNQCLLNVYEVEEPGFGGIGETDDYRLS